MKFEQRITINCPDNPSTSPPGLFGRAAEPSGSDKASEDIRSFSTLPKGWDYGRGGPISRRVIKDALFWNCFLISRGISDTEAIPSARGAILIAATIIGRYTEIISVPGGTVTVTQNRKPHPGIYLPGLTKKQTINLLLIMMRELWPTSVGFTQNISFPGKVSSGVRLSVTKPVGGNEVYL
jgi:hypothetical protein